MKKEKPITTSETPPFWILYQSGSMLIGVFSQCIGGFLLWLILEQRPYNLLPVLIPTIGYILFGATSYGLLRGINWVRRLILIIMIPTMLLLLGTWLVSIFIPDSGSAASFGIATSFSQLSGVFLMGLSIFALTRPSSKEWCSSKKELPSWTRMAVYAACLVSLGIVSQNVFHRALVSQAYQAETTISFEESPDEKTWEELKRGVRVFGHQFEPQITFDDEAKAFEIRGIAFTPITVRSRSSKGRFIVTILENSANEITVSLDSGSFTE